MGKTPRILKSGRQEDAFYEELWRTILAGNAWSGRVVNRRKDGGLFTVTQTVTPILDGGGVVTVEGEYKSFNADYTLASMPAADDCFCLFDGESVFATAAYLFPADVGPGKFQPYLRLVENSPSDATSNSSTELGLNYVVNGHNTRLNLSFVSGDANASGYAGDDVDILSLGMQVQL